MVGFSSFELWESGVERRMLAALRGAPGRCKAVADWLGNASGSQTTIPRTTAI